MPPETEQGTKLSVYHFEGCPYCALVRETADRLGLDLEWRDIEVDPRHRRDLVLARGRATVPVLRIARDGEPDVWMPESLDIVRYLEAHAHPSSSERTPTSAARSWGAWATGGAWALLLVGGLSPEPTRSLLWALACAVAAARSLRMATRSRLARHWLIAAALALGAVSNVLSGLGVVDVPWWHLAIAVSVIVLASSALRRNADARR